MQKIFRCLECRRAMRAVGSTGLGKHVPRAVTCPYCKARNEVLWPKGDDFRVQKVGIR
jgi:hypothetical protein